MEGFLLAEMLVLSLPVRKAQDRTPMLLAALIVRMYEVFPAFFQYAIAR